MKMLVIEDELRPRELLEHMLEQYGPVHTAQTATDALAAVRMALETKKPYDLVCLDIMLPDMNGHDVLALIRDMEARQGTKPADRMKIIMTSALHDPKNITSAFSRLCDAYIPKPFDAATLMEELKKLGLVRE